MRPLQDQGLFFGVASPARQMPAGLIDEKRRVCARRDLVASAAMCRFMAFFCHLEMMRIRWPFPMLSADPLPRSHKPARFVGPTARSDNAALELQRRSIRSFGRCGPPSAEPDLFVTGLDSLCAPGLLVSLARGKTF